MTRKVLLITNPAARRGAAWHGPALGAFRAAGVACDAVITEHAGHGGEVARAEASRVDAVFVLGGDGTAVEIIGALAGTGVPVGILPGGTGNQLARSLHIPLDVRRAVPVLLAGERRALDLGCLASGRRFAYTAGVGGDAAMIAETSAALKRALGIPAYSLAALRVGLRTHRFDVHAVVDGRTIERAASFAMIANVGTIMSGLFAFGPDIRADDGMLDLCLFSPRNAADMLRIVYRLYRRDFRPDPGMLHVRGHEFQIETATPEPMQVDGELLQPAPLHVRVAPRAALLLVPAA